jgi:hypothetical protein
MLLFLQRFSRIRIQPLRNELISFHFTDAFRRDSVSFPTIAFIPFYETCRYQESHHCVELISRKPRFDGSVLPEHKIRWFAISEIV